MSGPTAIALVPARAGSRRVPGKNVALLGGHPMLAYAIAAARGSGVFASVIVSTDSEEYAAIGRHYGAEVPFLRPAELAGDASTDVEWVADLLGRLDERPDVFGILRPTSPFRSADTIRRAWRTFVEAGDVDSLRAVERCTQHPGKMWVVRGGRMTPVLPVQPVGTPWHSRPTQSLPEVWVQNASLELAWIRCIEEGSIAGTHLVPFPTEGHEGFDVNTPYDLQHARFLVERGEAALPEVTEAPWSGIPEEDLRG